MLKKLTRASKPHFIFFKYIMKFTTILALIASAGVLSAFAVPLSMDGDSMDLMERDFDDDLFV